MPKPVPTIKKSSDFQKIFSSDKKNFSGNAGLYYLPSQTLEIGIVISKKQGTAVQRNRARRLIKEFFRLHQKKITPARIVIAVKAPLAVSYYEGEKIMLKLLRKAGLMKRRSRPEER